MKYIIVNTEKETLYNKEYLASFAIKGSIYPMKSWTNNFDYAIQFNSKEDAKSIINFLKVNTPYTPFWQTPDNRRKLRCMCRNPYIPDPVLPDVF